MDRTLHNANNAQRILELTADTRCIAGRRDDGICRGHRAVIATHESLQEDSTFRQGYRRTVAGADQG